MISIPRRLSYNGHATGAVETSVLVKDKIARAIGSRNVWTSSESSNTNNAWNVQFPSASVNNNNKNNTYAVRPLFASWDDYVASWIGAYDDCVRKKRTSPSCDRYRATWEHDLLLLAMEVYGRSYRPLPSNRFGVSHPRPREVFAAQFRDRIVHHWIALRVEPIIEERYESMGNVSTNCRKGYGTQLSVRTASEGIRRVSGGYTMEAFVGKFDLEACFTSVDVELLLGLVSRDLLPLYSGEDRDLLEWVIGVTLRNRPHEGAVLCGPKRLLDAVPEGKRMRGNRGVPIGNLPSQLFVNFLLSYLDEYILGVLEQEEDETFYIRFSDDFIVACRSRSSMKRIRRLADSFVSERLHMRLHPRKVYMQESRHGVHFLGCVIMPGRIYPDNTAVHALGRSLSRLEDACSSGTEDDIRKCTASANSYLGLMGHTESYGIRRRMLAERKCIWKRCYVTNRFRTIKTKKHDRNQ